MVTAGKVAGRGFLSVSCFKRTVRSFPGTYLQESRTTLVAKANESQNDGFREGHLRPFYFATLTVLLHDRSLLDISIFRTAELW